MSTKTNYRATLHITLEATTLIRSGGTEEEIKAEVEQRMLDFLAKHDMTPTKLTTQLDKLIPEGVLASRMGISDD